MNIHSRQHQHALSLLHPQWLVTSLMVAILSMTFGFERARSQTIDRLEDSANSHDWTSRPPNAGDKTGLRKKQSLEAYGRLPLAFEANQGQSDPQVRFIARGTGYGVFLTSTEAVLALRQPSKQTQDIRTLTAPAPAAVQTRGAVLRMKLVGASTTPQISGLEELPGKVNYFIGKDPAKWHTHIPTYAKVKYHDVYPGVDQIYYGNHGQMEYDLVVAPSADPKVIALRVEGGKAMTLNSQGDLMLDVEGESVVMHKPDVYQEINGARLVVEGSYRIQGEREVGFQIGEYDTTKPLVIDPVLIYSTYLGSTGSDTGNGIAADSLGNAYVTGGADISFPILNPYQPVYGGNGDAFVAKYDPAGVKIFSTYLGGNGFDAGFAIAVDGAGSAYFTGMTASPNFPGFGVPVTAPLQAMYGGGTEDAFVAKLNAAGNLVYSTYLGGAGDEIGRSIAVNAGYAYVTGETSSGNFPTAGGPVAIPLLATPSGGTDAFVAKFNLAGKALAYSTRINGSAAGSWASGIAVDGSGNAYVEGTTIATNFPTVGAYDSTANGDRDIFILKLNAAGNTLLYSTYVGGVDLDVGFALAIDALGKVYVTGYTFSSNFPTKTPIQATLGGTMDAYVLKIDPTLAGSASLIYSTYFGGSAGDMGYGIAVDSFGHACATGMTSSSDLLTLNPIQSGAAGGNDAFVAMLNPSGTGLVFSTYLGGATGSPTAWDEGRAVALDGSGNAYIAGRTQSTDFPVLNPAQPNAGGYREAFVAKISILPTSQPCVNPPNTTMVAWYPFDETSGTKAENLATGNIGTLFNSPIHLPGKVAGALRFDGVNDYVESSSTIATNIGTAGLPATCSGGYSTCKGDFSIDAWVRMPSGSSSLNMTLVEKRASTGPTARAYRFWIFNGRLFLQLADGGLAPGFTNYSSTPLPSLYTNQWHHVAVTVRRRGSPAGIRWYLDGLLMSTSNPLAAQPRYGSLVNKGSLRIGASTPTASNWFKGDMDELEIFNRELTQAEVKGIFTAGASGKCKP